MPNVLEDLVIDEISLCDRPANASVDPRTGRRTPRATVALFKRDSSGDPSAAKERELAARRNLLDRCAAFDGEVEAIKKRLSARRAKPKMKDDPGGQAVDPTKKETNNMSLKRILKSAVRDRASITEAVIAKAQKVAAKKGISRELAEAKIWKRRGGEAQESYESAPAGKPKRPEQKMMKVTSAEADLDERARKRMKKNAGMSYAKAVTEELMADPDLYNRYEAELRSGSSVYEVPASSAQYLDVPTN
jgi:hypothetical protein